MTQNNQHAQTWALAGQLCAPFEPADVRWRTVSVKVRRALVVAYVDARAVMGRLDAVFGVQGWQDAYELLANGNVVCKLRVRIGDDWIEKSDVGSQSDQQDEGDRTKSAFSDALKRAAVKLGIGRYLYRLPSQWVDYDPATKQTVSTPRLPAWAIPGGAPATPQPRPTSPPQLPARPAQPQAPQPPRKLPLAEMVPIDPDRQDDGHTGPVSQNRMMTIVSGLRQVAALGRMQLNDYYFALSRTEREAVAYLRNELKATAEAAEAVMDQIEADGHQMA
jgi:Rad52/22 family double-strand break repair protein